VLPLYDVNVLIAMFDDEHAQHDTTMRWHSEHAERGWASCPITQNGLIRVMSQPAYTRPLSTREVAERLFEATLDENHVFIPDDISLADPKVVAFDALLSHKTTTDIYLLALAVAHKAHFVTFDRGISLRAVVGATADHLITL
jgi:uncharacterized protein